MSDPIINCGVCGLAIETPDAQWKAGTAIVQRIPSDGNIEDHHRVLHKECVANSPEFSVVAPPTE